MVFKKPPPPPLEPPPRSTANNPPPLPTQGDMPTLPKHANSSKPLWKGRKYRAGGGIGIYSQEDAQTGEISISDSAGPPANQ